jgi:hypothetical protein
MRGLDPRIRAAVAVDVPRVDNSGMRGGWLYIMTNRPNGTLYVGVTSNIARRAWETGRASREALRNAMA